MEYTIRTATEQDIPAILELFELSLGAEGGAPIESFWRWKHIQNPFGHSPVLLAFDQKKLIGLRAFMRWEWRIGDSILPAFRAVDTATHPDFRGKGIFSKLTKELISELRLSEPTSFIYNTPNEQSKPGYLKMGWKVLGKPKVTGSLALAFGKQTQARFYKYHDALKQFVFEESPYKMSTEDKLIHTNQSLSYYKWRFQLIPKIPYGIFQYEWKGKGVLLFFHIKKRGRFFELRICDELWLKGEANMQLFLKASHSLAGELGTPFISYIRNTPVNIWQMIRFRTFPVQHFAPEITIREINDTGLVKKVEKIDSWSFRMGDLELF